MSKNLVKNALNSPFLPPIQQICKDFYYFWHKQIFYKQCLNALIISLSSLTLSLLIAAKEFYQASILSLGLGSIYVLYLASCALYGYLKNFFSLNPQLLSYRGAKLLEEILPSLGSQLTSALDFNGSPRRKAPPPPTLNLSSHKLLSLHLQQVAKQLQRLQLRKLTVYKQRRKRWLQLSGCLILSLLLALELIFFKVNLQQVEAAIQLNFYPQLATPLSNFLNTFRRLLPRKLPPSPATAPLEFSLLPPTTPTSPKHLHPGSGHKDLTLAYVYPPNLKIPPHKSPNTDGAILAPPKTQIVLTSTSDLPLKKAELILKENIPQQKEPKLTSLPVKLQDDRYLTATFTVQHSGTYQLLLQPRETPELLTTPAYPLQISTEQSVSKRSALKKLYKNQQEFHAYVVNKQFAFLKILQNWLYSDTNAPFPSESNANLSQALKTQKQIILIINYARQELQDLYLDLKLDHLSDLTTKVLWQNIREYLDSAFTLRLEYLRRLENKFAHSTFKASRTIFAELQRSQISTLRNYLLYLEEFTYNKQAQAGRFKPLHDPHALGQKDMQETLLKIEQIVSNLQDRQTKLEQQTTHLKSKLKKAPTYRQTSILPLEKIIVEQEKLRQATKDLAAHLENINRSFPLFSFATRKTLQLAESEMLEAIYLLEKNNYAKALNYQLSALKQLYKLQKAMQKNRLKEPTTIPLPIYL